MLQEHNDPMTDPKKKFVKMKLGLTKRERDEVERRSGRHSNIAPFVRHAVQSALDGNATVPDTLPLRPLGYRKQLLVRIPVTHETWVRQRAEKLGSIPTDFLVALLMAFPETPKDAVIRRVSRNSKITTATGRIEMKLVYIGSLLLGFQQLFHETASPVTAVEATALLSRIADASEAVARGGEIPADETGMRDEGGTK